MARYWSSYWFRAGLILLVVGSGPLFAIMLAAKIGLLRDPNPNPVGEGMLCGFTFTPAVVCIIVGVVRVRRREAQ